MAKSKRYYIRKSHRYLGVLLGIQFLFWTIGGLYFSWTNLDEIHGDLNRKPVPRLKGSIRMISPDSVLKQEEYAVDSIHSVQMVTILQKPYWSIRYFSGKEMRTVLADAGTGVLRGDVEKEEAIRIARESFAGDPQVKSVEYITSTRGHHEYRAKPLPTWAVTFDHPSNTTVYVSADHGRIESFRNNQWRVFDFLWMMHTMDYRERDNINNWLLRAFSLFGLLTILSGFALYWVSRKRKGRQQPPKSKLIRIYPPQS